MSKLDPDARHIWNCDCCPTPPVPWPFLSPVHASSWPRSSISKRDISSRPPRQWLAVMASCNWLAIVLVSPRVPQTRMILLSVDDPIIGESRNEYSGTVCLPDRSKVLLLFAGPRRLWQSWLAKDEWQGVFYYNPGVREIDRVAFSMRSFICVTAAKPFRTPANTSFEITYCCFFWGGTLRSSAGKKDR